MPGSRFGPSGRQAAEVLVMGGGLAGLATAIELTRRGRDVIVVDDGAGHPPSLGESLEFTAPGFLERLGLDRDSVVERGLGHPKTNVHVSHAGEDDFEIWPPGWFGRAPFFCSNATVHIDRVAVDEALRTTASDLGVRFVDDRVVDLERLGRDRIVAANTADGRRLTGGWFVDATGSRTRLIGRALRIRWRPEGPARVAYHGRLTVPPARDVTTLRFWTGRSGELTWGWIIPLGPGEVSIGLCPPSAEVAVHRAAGGDRTELLRWFLEASPELAATEPPDRIEAVAYTPGSHHRASGANWVLVGDAAALVDPLTSSGVAAALRGAETAAALIAAEGSGAMVRARHHHGAVRTVTAANTVIDRMLFQPGLRQLIGHRLAVFSFAAPVLVIHAWYARFARGGPVGLAIHGAMTMVVRPLARVIGRVSGGRAAAVAARLVGRGERRRQVASRRDGWPPPVAPTSRATGDGRSRTAGRSAGWTGGPSATTVAPPPRVP